MPPRTTYDGPHVVTITKDAGDHIAQCACKWQSPGWSTPERATRAGDRHTDRKNA